MSDLDDEMGPMGVIPDSHKDELFDLYDENNQWTGALTDEDSARAGTEKAVWLKGARGSVTVHKLPHDPRFHAKPISTHAPAPASDVRIC